jgi:hypothetical protein
MKKVATDIYSVKKIQKVSRTVNFLNHCMLPKRGIRRFGYACLCLLLLSVSVSAQAGYRQVGVSEGIRVDGSLDFLNSEGRVLASIAIEIADTAQSRRQGLMGRRGLDDSMGMLFVYEDAFERGFWMHNTPTPLDIIFVSKQRRVIRIAADTVPMSDAMHVSGGPAQYVVEVPAGFCKRHGITEGVVIRWRRSGDAH